MMKFLVIKQQVIIYVLRDEHCEPDHKDKLNQLQ